MALQYLFNKNLATVIVHVFVSSEPIVIAQSNLIIIVLVIEGPSEFSWNQSLAIPYKLAYPPCIVVSAWQSPQS